MNYAPLARILLRYGVGIALGTEVGQLLAGDADIVAVVALLIGAATEVVYAQAKKHGWAT
jgi:imidazolonepropionase-like amidohydrolase